MEENKLSAKISALSVLTSFIATALASLVFSSLIMVLFGFIGLTQNDYTNFANSGVGYLISSLVLYFVMFMVFFKFNKNKSNNITSKFSFKKLIIYTLIAIAVFFLVSPIVNWLSHYLTKAGFEPSVIPYELTTGNYIISIISLVLLPAICEELLFRGLIFKGLKKHGKILSCTLTALLFGIYHMSIFQTVYPLVFGLILCVIMYNENNIIYCIVAHAVNNFLALTTQYLNTNLITFNVVWLCVLFVVFVAIIACTILALKHNSKNKETKQMDKTNKLYLIFAFACLSIVWIIATIFSILWKIKTFLK